MDFNFAIYNNSGTKIKKEEEEDYIKKYLLYFVN